MTAPTPASYRPATAAAAGSSAISTASTSAAAADTAKSGSAAQSGAEKSEGHHLWAHESFSFSDVLDTINPLQHLPIISMIYRSITGDNIGNVARVAGDGLYGGVIGAVFGMVDAVMVEETGKDVGGNIIAMVTGDEKEGKIASGTGKATQDPAPVVNPDGDNAANASSSPGSNASFNPGTHWGGGHGAGRGIAREDAPADTALSGHVAHAHAELMPGSALPAAGTPGQGTAAPSRNLGGGTGDNINDLYEKALAARTANSKGPALADPNKPLDLPFFPGMNGGSRHAGPAPQASNPQANGIQTAAGIPINLAVPNGSTQNSGNPNSGTATPSAAGGHGMNPLPGTTAAHGYAIDTSPNGLLAMRAATHTSQAVPLQLPPGSGLTNPPPMPPASLNDFAQRMKQGMDKYAALMAQKKLGADSGATTTGSQLNQNY